MSTVLENPPVADCMIKCRERGKLQFAFLTSKGALNRLRIHAARFTRENAEKLIAENQAENAEWEFCIVPAALFASVPVQGPPCLKCKHPFTKAVRGEIWQCDNCGHWEPIDKSGI